MSVCMELGLTFPNVKNDPVASTGPTPPHLPLIFVSAGSPETDIFWVEGREGFKSQTYESCLPALFLTLGKVNSHRHFRGGGPQTDILLGGVQSTNLPKPNGVEQTRRRLRRTRIRVLNHVRSSACREEVGDLPELAEEIIEKYRKADAAEIRAARLDGRSAPRSATSHDGKMRSGGVARL